MPKNSSVCLACCCYDNWECTVTQTLIHTPVTHKQCLGDRWMGCIHLGGNNVPEQTQEICLWYCRQNGVWCEDSPPTSSLQLHSSTHPYWALLYIHLQPISLHTTSTVTHTNSSTLTSPSESSPLPSPSLHHSHTTLTPLQHSRTTPTLTGPPKQSKMLSEQSSASSRICSAAWVVFTGADQIRPTLRARRSRELKASRWIILLHRDRKLCCEWGMKFNRWGLAHAHPQHCAVAQTYKLHPPPRHCRATYISAKCHLNSLSNQQQLLTHNM